ncbi:transposase, partial [Bifidobacterium animalis]|uniref:transposase n=1 Tax=Bifidobacterium animalis TaxID=28025 RepID=UPI003AF31D79
GRYHGCREPASLGRVLKRRMRDILALFRPPRSSNGPAEAINGRLETLRGNAMGFANTTSYIQRCLIQTKETLGVEHATLGFRPCLLIQFLYHTSNDEARP